MNLTGELYGKPAWYQLLWYGLYHIFIEENRNKAYRSDPIWKLWMHFWYKHIYLCKYKTLSLQSVRFQVCSDVLVDVLAVCVHAGTYPLPFVRLLTCRVLIQGVQWNVRQRHYQLKILQITQQDCDDPQYVTQLLHWYLRRSSTVTLEYLRRYSNRVAVW